MFGAYKETIEFLKEKPIVIWMILIVALIMSPLKSNLFTIMTPFFFQTFFIGGVLGVARDYKKINKVGFKAVFVNASKNFSYIIFNMVSSFIILIINCIIVLFFSILPIIITGAGIDERHSKILLVIILLPVILYRIPIFMMSIVTPAAVSKDGGKYAIIKIKEVIWHNPKFFIGIIIQFIIYCIIVIANIYLQSSILSQNSGGIRILFFTLFDVFAEMYLTFMIISNFYFYYRKINENEEFKEKLNEHTYNGKYKGFIGKFVM